VLHRLASGTVRAALARPRIRRLVDAELKPQAKASRATEPKLTPPVLPDAFVDRHGVRHPLDRGHRDALKPGWRTLLDPVAAAAPPTEARIQGRVAGARTTVAAAEAFVRTTTGQRLTRRILEVGCYDGATAFQLATIEGARVTASDLARYYVVQRPAEPAEEAITRQHGELAALRERARVAAGAPEGTVAFVEDDITASTLEPGSFDAIVSFEVLEHVDAHRAFASMARLLRPGGVGYHDYNPFFALNGGHALCTLDFPWGHARLDADDVERYVREVRPGEAAQALRFYRENLNRMTQADLRVWVAEAGLELVAMLPWNDRSLAARLGDDVLGEVRRAYPAATVADLLGTFVAVVVRRPA
jgi:SAM-dependent methyltransferase